jgi:hypothetical protein
MLHIGDDWLEISKSLSIYQFWWLLSSIFVLSFQGEVFDANNTKCNRYFSSEEYSNWHDLQKKLGSPGLGWTLLSGFPFIGGVFFYQVVFNMTQVLSIPPTWSVLLITIDAIKVWIIRIRISSGCFGRCNRRKNEQNQVYICKSCKIIAITTFMSKKIKLKFTSSTF